MQERCEVHADHCQNLEISVSFNNLIAIIVVITEREAVEKLKVPNSGHCQTGGSGFCPEG
jgi:hypothetical protein